MKDYNLRSRDIYGQPQQRGGRGWLKLGVILVVIAAAVAYFQFKGRAPTPAPQAAPPNATNPNIIPLTLPPRSPSPGPAAPR